MPSEQLIALLERIRKPRILYHRIHPEEPAKSPKQSKKLIMLLDRIATRRWLSVVQDQLMEAVADLRGEVKFIEHLPGCWLCKMELKLDVERYLGNRSFWYLCLENSEYLEARYPSCPKERDYHIGSYWEKVQYYRQYGNTDVPGENTTEFILDRAKWAYKIMGKQIRLLRQLLRLARNWNFSEEQTSTFQRLYNRLGMYEIALPFEV
jgi:hypothetical protein